MKSNKNLEPSGMKIKTSPLKKKHHEPDRGWDGVALDAEQLRDMYEHCNSGFAKEGKSAENAIANVYKGSASSHVHSRSSCEDYSGYCYYCGLNLDALDARDTGTKQKLKEPEPIVETELHSILEDVTQGKKTKEIDYDKLEKVVKENIKEILEREKKLPKGSHIDIRHVESRDETKGETGYYQYDYWIWKEHDRTPFGGTVYGDISAGVMLDMQLELYDERK